MPLMCRAARPMVWISERPERRKPSLSASRIATSDGVDVGVQIPDAHAVLVQIIGEVLRHPLGQRRHQHALLLVGAQPDLGEQVVDLRLRRPDLQHRIDEAGRAHELLDDLPGVFLLVVGGRGRHERRHAIHAVPLHHGARHEARAIHGERERCITGRCGGRRE